MDRPHEGQTPGMQRLGLQGHPCRWAVSQPIEEARKGSEVQTEVALLTLRLPAPASRTGGPSGLLPAARFVGLLFRQPQGSQSIPSQQPRCPARRWEGAAPSRGWECANLGAGG